MGCPRQSSVTGVVCQEFQSFGSVREPFWVSAHAFISEMERSGIQPCQENNFLTFFYSKIDIYPLCIQPSLWFPTTLRYSPLFPVSVRLTANISDPPKFS